MKGISLSSLNPCPVFNDKEIAERESEPVLSGENRKCFDINYKPFGKGLVMASFNINSLVAHIDEFRVFMNDSNMVIVSIIMKQSLIPQLIITRFIYPRLRNSKWTTRRGCLYLCKMQS